jgi:hypothetical protein
MLMTRVRLLCALLLAALSVGPPIAVAEEFDSHFANWRQVVANPMSEPSHVSGVMRLMFAAAKTERQRETVIGELMKVLDGEHLLQPRDRRRLRKEVAALRKKEDAVGRQREESDDWQTLADEQMRLRNERRLRERLLAGPREILDSVLDLVGDYKRNRALWTAIIDHVDEDAPLGANCLEALRRHPRPEAFDAVAEALRRVGRRDGGARALALQTAFRIDRDKAAPLLIEALRDRQPIVQLAAIRGLRELGDVRAVAALVAAVGIMHDRVRHVGLAALYHLTGQKLGPESAPWHQWWAIAGGDFEPESHDVDDSVMENPARFFGLAIDSPQVLFVLCNSKSMDNAYDSGKPGTGSRWARVCDELESVLGAMPEDHEIGVVAFGNDAELMNRGRLFGNSPGARAKVLAALRRAEPGGARNMLGGLLAGLSLCLEDDEFAGPAVGPDAELRASTLVLVTDGQANFGPAVETILPSDNKNLYNDKLVAHLQMMNETRGITIHVVELARRLPDELEPDPNGDPFAGDTTTDTPLQQLAASSLGFYTAPQPGDDD